MGIEIGLITVIVFDVIRLLNNCYVTNSVYTCNYMIHMLIQVSNNFLLADENQQYTWIRSVAEERPIPIGGSMMQYIKCRCWVVGHF